MLDLFEECIIKLCQLKFTNTEYMLMDRNKEVLEKPNGSGRKASDDNNILYLCTFVIIVNYLSFIFVFS